MLTILFDCYKYCALKQIQFFNEKIYFNIKSNDFIKTYQQFNDRMSVMISCLFYFIDSLQKIKINFFI